MGLRRQKSAVVAALPDHVYTDIARAFLRLLGSGHNYHAIAKVLAHICLDIIQRIIRFICFGKRKDKFEKLFYPGANSRNDEGGHTTQGVNPKHQQTCITSRKSMGTDLRPVESDNDFQSPPPLDSFDEVDRSIKLMGEALRDTTDNAWSPAALWTFIEGTIRVREALTVERIYSDVHFDRHTSMVCSPLDTIHRRRRLEHRLEQSAMAARPQNIQWKGISSRSGKIMPSQVEVEASSRTSDVHSATGSLQKANVSDYISILVEDVCKVMIFNNDVDNFDTFVPSLDWALAAFSLRIRNESTDKYYWAISDLTHYYRRDIVDQLYQKYHDRTEFQRGMSRGLLPADDDIDLFWGGGRTTDTSGKLPAIQEHETEVSMRHLPDLAKYMKILHISYSYGWLLSAIERTQVLQIPDHAAETCSIEYQLINGMRMPGAMGMRLNTFVELEFQVDWGFRVFHNEQAYSESLETVLETAITLTGNHNSVQAITCIDYVRQTWGTEGAELVLFLQKLVQSSSVSSPGRDAEEEARTTTTLSSGTRIKSLWHNNLLVLVASGVSYCVAEVGAQLAWMSTALASSKNDTSITYSAPSVWKTASRFEKPLGVLQQKWVIEHELIGLRPCRDNGAPGGCWQGLFRNPVVVHGYPIPRRMISNSGLEVSFDIMTALSNTRQLVNFEGRTFLKGFSTMMAITKVVGNTIWWHLCLNEDRRYISFEDYRMPLAGGPECIVDVPQLSTSRHILGWSRKVKNIAGSAGANYDSIMHSGLGQPRSFVAFDRISVSTGKIVSVGVSASIGNKDKSWQINFDDDYVRTLSAIAARHFLFYDVSERQAWLIDGVSTVLHALRTYLKGCKSDEILQAVVLPGFDELVEADDEFFGARAAFEVLQKNRDRPLWPQHKRGASNQEDQFFRVEAKVREICTALQLITAHVDNMRDGAGFRLKLNPRDQLEGFDFVSLASDEPTFRHKVHTISASGEAWVDFTRAIYTPTLFGRGFGHMFQPFEKACETCKWNEPPGKDLLAVSVKDLKRIIKKHGNSDTNPCLLAPKIVWLTPDQCFESCNCSTASPIKRDRVQVCLSDGLRARLLRDPRSPTELFDDDGQYDRGAVLFGYSSKMRWVKRRVANEDGSSTRTLRPARPSISEMR